MSSSFSNLNQAGGVLVVPKLISGEVADAFLRTLWGDVVSQRVVTQTHQDTLLRKNALEIHGRNYPLLLALHWGLTSIVAEKAGADLLPSFAYFRLYYGGDVCRIHSDRSACEVSSSLTLGYSDGKQWPLDVATQEVGDRISIEDDFGDEPYATFDMEPGDAVIYRGSSYRHGRLRPNPNRWSAHLFLMWVKKGGPHEPEAFERLEFAETPKIG